MMVFSRRAAFLNEGVQQQQCNNNIIRSRGGVGEDAARDGGGGGQRRALSCFSPSAQSQDDYDDDVMSPFSAEK